MSNRPKRLLNMLTNEAEKEKCARDGPKNLFSGPKLSFERPILALSVAVRMERNFYVKSEENSD